MNLRKERKEMTPTIKKKEPKDNTICCTAHLWGYLTGDIESEDCPESNCCFHCVKRGTSRCIGGLTACNTERNRRKYYPEECKIYPVTYVEMKNLIIFSKIFKGKDPLSGYSYFDTIVRRYVKERKELNDKEKKE